VSVDMSRDHAADDSRRDQRDERARRDEPLLVPAALRLEPAQLRARVRVNGLQDRPGGPRRRQGVEN